MPDLLEDDELCTICWDAPVLDRSRRSECLAFFLRNHVDPVGPRQEPKLSELEALRITKALATEASIEWLMVDDGHGRDLLTFSDLLRRPEWHRRAACRGSGTSAFFPVRGEPTMPAKALCESCEVRDECLAVALPDPEIGGVWGGSSAPERLRMRRAQRSVA